MPGHRDLSITRAEVTRAVKAAGWSDGAAALEISAGLAFMIVSGVPADASGTPSFREQLDGELQLSSPQTLVNPRGHNPLRDEHVLDWVRDRAARELKQQ